MATPFLLRDSCPHPFQSILVRWFLECRCSLLPSLVWPLPICLDSWIWHSRFLCNIALSSIGPCFYHQSQPQLGIVFALAPSLHSFWSYFSTDLQQHIGHLLTWEVPRSVSNYFAFSYCSWGSEGKNAEVVCHSLLQWTSHHIYLRIPVVLQLHWAPEAGHQDWVTSASPLGLIQWLIRGEGQTSECNLKWMYDPVSETESWVTGRSKGREGNRPL